MVRIRIEDVEISNQAELEDIQESVNFAVEGVNEDNNTSMSIQVEHDGKDLYLLIENPDVQSIFDLGANIQEYCFDIYEKDDE